MFSKSLHHYDVNNSLSPAVNIPWKGRSELMQGRHHILAVKYFSKFQPSPVLLGGKHASYDIEKLPVGRASFPTLMQD